MTLWTTIIDHRFPDANINNFYSIPGSLSLNGTIRPPELRPNSDNPTDLYHASFNGSQGLIFQLNEPINDIVNMRIRVVVTTEAKVSNILRNLVVNPDSFFQSGKMQILNVNGLVVSLIFDSSTQSPGTHIRPYIASVEPGGVVNPKRISIPRDNWITLDLEWNISGRLALFLDGTLIGFTNNFHSEACYSIPQITIGYDRISNKIAGHVGRIKHIRVDVIEEINSDLLITNYPNIDPKDAKKIQDCISNHKKVARTARENVYKFWAAFTKSESNPWTIMDSNSSPYSERIKNLNKLSTEFTSLYAQVLYGKRTKLIPKLLDVFKKIASLLYESNSSEMKRIVAEFDKQNTLSQECEEVLNEFLKTYEKTIDPVSGLLKEMIDILREVVS